MYSSAENSAFLEMTRKICIKPHEKSGAALTAALHGCGPLAVTRAPPWPLPGLKCTISGDLWGSNAEGHHAIP